MIEIPANDFDDKDFISIVEKVLNSFVQSSQPDEIYIVKIDHWFDFKWREFAGKLFGAVGFWKKELIIPPFIPDRVSETKSFEKLDETYVERETPGLHFYWGSGENITNRQKLVTFSAPRFFFWFSGETKNTGRGSMMLYQIEKENRYSWYVSLLKKENWQVYKTAGISRQEVLSLI